MKIPKRMPYELLILSGLLVGSCSRPEWEDRLDVADVNSRNAIARVDDLEGRVADIEQQLNMQVN